MSGADMARLMVRSGVLHRIQESRGTTDSAMAQAIGVSENTYRQVRDRKRSPSGRFIAGACIAFSLSINQLVELVDNGIQDNLDRQPRLGRLIVGPHSSPFHTP